MIGGIVFWKNWGANRMGELGRDGREWINWADGRGRFFWLIDVGIGWLIEVGIGMADRGEWFGWDGRMGEGGRAGGIVGVKGVYGVKLLAGVEGMWTGRGVLGQLRGIVGEF